MKNKLIKFSLILALLFSSLVSANTVSKITFIGLETSSESSLRKIIPFDTSQEFSSEVSDKIIESLFQTGYFSDISVSISNQNLLISVKENPYIKYLNISNIGKKWYSLDADLFSDVELNDFSKENGIAPGNIFIKNNLDSFVTFLKQQYISQGFNNVNIESNYEVDIQNRAAIELEVIQGNRAKISSFSIAGFEKISEKTLLSIFSLGESDFSVINFFTKKDQYTDTAFQKGLDNLTNYYYNLGYLDFRILNVESNLSQNNELIDIIVNISEGNQYKLGELTFSGELLNKSQNELIAIIPLKQGDIFNRNEIINGIQLINDEFSDLGYAYAEIEPQIFEVLDVVNVNINILLNKKVYVNRITISGNTRTQDEVIRREIGVAEGGLYSRSYLRDSVLKLRRLGYFSDVEMSASEVEGMPDKINLNFVVSETKTGAVSFSLSHSNNYGISIGAGIKEKNIFGSGNTFNTEFKLSDSFNKVSFYFEDPYFNEDGHSISYGAFASKIKDDDVMEDSYEISTKGVNFGYGVPISKSSRINADLIYSQNDIKCGSSFSSSAYESSQCAQLNPDETKLSLNWSDSTLNDYLYPTDGKSNSINFGIALPVSDHRYIDLNLSHKSYSPVSNDLTLKLSGSMDLLKGYDGKDAPFYKRYFGGGSGSIRGFKNKSLGPLYPNGNAKGGELSILGSASLIAPAYFFDDNENMRMSAFIDAGNIFEKSSNIDLSDIRMTTGIGFAYLSPIGAIGFYWSIPILEKTGDITEDFGFSLGTGF